MPTSVGSYTNNEVPKPPKPPVVPNPQPTFLYPVSGAQVSQAYGNRPTNPNISYQSGTNLGTDFSAAAGSAVNSPVSGRVLSVNPNAGAWGNQVVVDAGNGRQLSFNHLAGFGKIKKGQAINAGYTLGQVGATGQTTGPHLDLEATVNGTSVPLGTAFKGYQFDKAYKGVNLTTKGARGYNRSQNKFYNLGDLGQGTGSSTAVNSSGVAPRTNPSAGAVPVAPRAAQAAMADDYETPSGPSAGDISVLNPNKSIQFGSLNTSGPMVVR